MNNTKKIILMFLLDNTFNEKTSKYGVHNGKLSISENYNCKGF